MTTLDAIYCPNCKTTLDPEAAFCLMCGLDQRRSARLRAEAAPGAYSVHELQPIPKPGIPLTVANTAVIVGAIVIVSIIAVCYFRHPLGCLLATVVIVLPLTALFQKQFRRSPVVPGAIACCLFLFTNQILDQTHDKRVAAFEERQSAEAIAPSPALPQVQPPTRALPPGTNVPGERIITEPVGPRQYGRRFGGGGGFRRFMQNRGRHEGRIGQPTFVRQGPGGGMQPMAPGPALPQIPGLTGTPGDVDDN